MSGGSFSEHRCRFRAKRDYQPQPVSVSSFDDFNKDLAKRVTDVLVPGGAADFQVVVTPATDPIGTLYRKGRSVPFDDTACAPSAEPIPRSLPNAFPSYTLDAKVAADVGLDQALLQGVADLGTSLDAETSFNFSILDARMKVLTDRAVEQLLAASNCAAAATKEMVIVRGYVAGQRQFSTKSNRTGSAGAGVRNVGKFKVEADNGGLISITTMLHRSSCRYFGDLRRDGCPPATGPLYAGAGEGRARARLTRLSGAEAMRTVHRGFRWTGGAALIFTAMCAAAWLAVSLDAQSAVREAFADLPGVRLFYRDTGGNGAPVVFVHAATGNSRVWEYQLPAFTAAGYRVVAYDRRGFGDSVIDPAGPQPGTAADDLLGLVNHLRLDRVHLIGTAAGGGVSFDFALSFPERVRSLVIANAGGNVQDADYLELGRRMRPAPQFDALPPDVRELGPSYRAANGGGTRRWLKLHDLSWPGGSPPKAQNTRNRITFAMLETLKVPTLLLTGDADLFTPPSVLRLFTARIKGAESVIVRESGHSAYWEQPEIFNRTVLEFLRKH